MSDLAREKYDQTAVGGVGIITPSESRQADLASFQAVVEAARVMEAEALIDILELHRESATGKRYVDAIKFRRLK